MLIRLFLILFFSFFIVHAKMSLTYVYQETGFETAIKNNDYEKIDSLLKLGGDINEKDARALKVAISLNSIEMVEFLLSKNASVNIANNANSHSPLPLIAMKSYVDSKEQDKAVQILRLILSKKPNIERLENQYYEGCIRDDSKMTPIFWATANHKMLKALIDSGANIFHKSASGKSLLYFATSNGDEKSVEMLLNLGLKPTEKNATSPLLAISNLLGNSYTKDAAFNIAKLLIENGAFVDARDYYGNTLLHEVARNDDLEIAQLLVENGADVNIFDTNSNFGFSPLYLRLFNLFPFLESKDNFKIIKLLVENGAKLNVKTISKNQTALDIVYENVLAHAHNKDIKKFEDLELVKYLRSKGAKRSK